MTFELVSASPGFQSASSGASPVAWEAPHEELDAEFCAIESRNLDLQWRFDF